MGDALMAIRALTLCLALLVLACASTPQSGSREGTSQAPTSSGPKRVVISIRGEPNTFSKKIDSSPSVPGGPEMEQLVHAGLAIQDGDGIFRPQIAEAVPSLENGFWKLSPDGRMETTWKIKPNARWHDGHAFTADDLLFTWRVASDKDVAEFRDVAFDSIDGLEAPDQHTVVVRWKRPFTAADSLFTQDLAMPMPKHVMESAFLQDRATFTQQPFWGADFVGAGPFKIRDWIRGSSLVVDANPDYVLGRPKLDQIEVRFITDTGTMFANLLARAVELNLGGRNIGLEQGIEARGQWDGRMEIKRSSRFTTYPQFLNPDPQVVGDVRFRRALLHAIDRQQLSEVLLPGAESPVAHNFLNPSEPEFRETEPAVVKYPYDPGRAAALLRELGYTPGPDAILRDAAGQRLFVELRSGSTADLNQKIALSMIDAWQRVGVASEMIVVPTQRQRDLQYRANFPAFDMTRQPAAIGTLNNLYSSEARLADTGYLGRNYARYMNPALDTLVDRYFNTVPWQERMEVGRQIMHHITDQAVWLDLFYDAAPLLISSRLKNVAASKAEGALDTWNAHAWDVN
jgi:peptide/nickel transport system substrate-binding protein